MSLTGGSWAAGGGTWGGGRRPAINKMEKMELVDDNNTTQSAFKQLPCLEVSIKQRFAGFT